MYLDQRRQNLYAVEYKTGTVYSYPLNPGGSPGAPKIIAAGVADLLNITMNDQGDIYGIIYGEHALIKITPDGPVEKRVVNMINPIGMSFGGKGFNRQALYIACDGGIMEVDLDQNKAN